MMIIQEFFLYLKCGLERMTEIIESAFQIGKKICIVIIYVHLYGLIIDPHNDQLPIGLLAQLVGHCTGIAEVRGRIPVQA